MADLSNKDKGEFTIVDPDNNDNELHISSSGSLRAEVYDDASGNNIVPRSDGSLNVNANIGGIPEIPEGSTRVVVTAPPTGVATTSGVDTYYTITNGKTLTIQSFSAGGEEEVGGSAVDLYYDENGDLSVLTWLNTIYINGATAQLSVGVDYDGDGTARIVLRERGFTANSRELAARWYGYEETT
jgi:hypothetical protein